MNIFCGTDIIEVVRIKEAIENVKGFKEKVYTKNEILDIEKTSGEQKYERYAGRFAAKEAVYKSLSEILIKNKIDMYINQVEILNDDDLGRRPKVAFVDNNLNEFINANSIQIDVSISHIKENAIAMAVARRREE